MAEQQALDEQFAQQVTLDDEQKLKTFFSKDKYYLPVPEDKKITIIPFLEKTEMIVDVFALLVEDQKSLCMSFVRKQFLVITANPEDAFGNVFKLVKSDMLGNIKKLRDVHERDPMKLVTLSDLLDYEIETKDTKKYAMVSGVWLGRALEFMQLFFQSLVDEHDEEKLPDDTLTKNVQKAYNNSLRPYHNFVSKGIFGAVSHAAPYRTDLFKGLLIGLSKEEIAALPKQQIHNSVIQDLSGFLNSLKGWVELFMNTYKEYDLNK